MEDLSVGTLGGNSSSKNQEESLVEQLIPGFNDVNGFSQTLLAATVRATKASNELPSGDSYDYYNSFRTFRQVLSAEGKNIFSILTPILKYHGCRINFENLELEDKFDALVDATDSILEKVGNALDEASGVKKKNDELIIATVNAEKVISSSWNRKKNIQSPQSQFRLLSSKSIVRPQLHFRDKVDNTNSPFAPIITEKPNSLKPLAILPLETEFGEEYGHPYEVEIDHFQPSEEMLMPVEPQKPQPLEETPLVFVNTVTDVKNLCDDLRKQKEFAVDLEHHSYRTYQGFTCLMQISTREKDYIVDTLELRRDLTILNEVFTDPKIVKVLHGADMDILWLQRDLGIYVVNMFDTGQAARVMEFARISLAYLLKHYLHFEPNKEFQLADWRIRPLPKEMLKYAREDTHYLLYIYDCMRNDLLAKANTQTNLLASVYQRSKLICLKTYKKPDFNEESYLELYKKSKKVFNSRQLHALKHLYAWRDKIARIEDESIGYVLPNHMLLQIAEVLPREQQGILACCNPIPPLVKQQLNELHAIILKARETSIVKPEASRFQIEVSVAQSNIDMESLLHCPHDIIHAERDEHLPTLLDFEDDDMISCQELNQKSDSQESENMGSPILLKDKPLLSAIIHEDVLLDKATGLQQVGTVLKKFISPFERYKLVKPTRDPNDDKNDSAAETFVIVKKEKESEGESSKLQEEPSQTIQLSVETTVQEIQESVDQSEAPEVSEDLPLRRKNKKKRKQKLTPDIAFLVNNEPGKEPPAKFAKTDETGETSFKAFDYNKAQESRCADASKSKDFNPQALAESFLQSFKPPGKSNKSGKSGNQKSKTFRARSKKQQSRGQGNWPRR